MTQADLPLSRATDPLTSHVTEREIRAEGTLVRQLLGVLFVVTHGPGLTAREYQVEFRHISGNAVFHKRLPDLEKRGLVRRGEPRRCRIGNRLAATWFAVEKDNH